MSAPSGAKLPKKQYETLRDPKTGKVIIDPKTGKPAKFLIRY